MKQILLFFLLTAYCLLADTGLYEQGYASWYGGKFQGRQTANGEIFDTNQLTAAHKYLPFDTVVEVVNLGNAKRVTVRINDRGPFVDGRIIDLSYKAAQEIEMVSAGIAPVALRVLSSPASIEQFQNKVADPPGYVRPVFYRIQIGSYQDEDNAIHMCKVLEEKGFSPEIEAAETGHFRVVISRISAADLEDYKAQLGHAGYTNVLIRQEAFYQN